MFFTPANQQVKLTHKLINYQLKFGRYKQYSIGWKHNTQPQLTRVRGLYMSIYIWLYVIIYGCIYIYIFPIGPKRGSLFAYEGVGQSESVQRETSSAAAAALIPCSVIGATRRSLQNGLSLLLLISSNFQLQPNPQIYNICVQFIKSPTPTSIWH